MKLEEIVENESGLVDELRRRFKGQMSEEMFADDSLFQRFLRARCHDLDASETMLKNHLNWRKSQNIDAIADFKAPEVLKIYTAISQIGYDKDGSPICYLDYGNFDCRGALKSATHKVALRHYVQHFENIILELKEQSKKKGKPVHKFIFIFNFDNFALYTATHKPSVDLFLDITRTFEANYPETLKVAYVINASFIFTIGWVLVKPLLSGPTVRKVLIYGKGGWQNDMLSHIDADVLPAFLGGTRTDPDGNPKCKSLIQFSAPIPESYYLNRNINKISTLPGSKMAIVHRLSKMQLKFEVFMPGSCIEWEFMVKTRDIVYSLRYKSHDDGESDEKQIFPKERTDSDARFFTCQQAGIYILEFDNTYSWLHNKEVHYVVSLIRPGGHKSGF